MALIAPFCGLRFNAPEIVQLEDVVTPPYDVIGVEDKATLLSKNQYNMVQLDLSKNFTKESLTVERYAQARDLFVQWQEENVLIREQLPAIYLYYIDYTHPCGQRFTRKGLVALVQLAEFSEKIIKPHEHTFSEVTADRVRLLDTCRAQFSKIFTVYPDKQGEIINALEEVRPKNPLCTTVDHDGCQHTIWAITDEDVCHQVQKMFKSKALYIADGHHRYNTALQLKKLITERQGTLSDDSPFNYTMMYLCGIEEPGLSILPAHRLVKMPEKIGADKLTEQIAEGFQITEIKGDNLLDKLLKKMADNNAKNSLFGLYHPAADRYFLLTMKKDAHKHAALTSQPEVLRQLDVVVLSDLIIAQYLGLDYKKCEQEKLIDYYSNPTAAISEAVKLAGCSDKITPVLFLLNHTPVSQVKEVADEGQVMPHKSTYFYPKILTGLLINKLVEGEKV